MSIWQAARWIAAGMLLLALFDMPDAFYSALRLVVTAAAVMEILQIRKSRMSENAKTGWTLGFAAIAIIFNPILPLDMERETWAWFDVGTASIFGWVASVSRRLDQRIGIVASIFVIPMAVIGVVAQIEEDAQREYNQREHARYQQYLAEQEAEKIAKKKADFEEFLARPTRSKISNRDAFKMATDLKRWEESGKSPGSFNSQVHRDDKREALKEWQNTNYESILYRFGFTVSLMKEIQSQKATLPTERELAWQREKERIIASRAAERKEADQRLREVFEKYPLRATSAPEPINGTAVQKTEPVSP